MGKFGSQLRQGSDGRIIWTFRMDAEFERVFKLARSLEPPPTLAVTLEMIRKAVLEKFPELQAGGFTVAQVQSRYQWFRRHHPNGYAFRIAHKPNRKVEAIADVVDSEKRRKLEAIETLFPTYDINERLKRIEERLGMIEDRVGATLRSVVSIEGMLAPRLEQIAAQFSLLLKDLGVEEAKVLRLLERKQDDPAGKASNSPGLQVVAQEA